MGKLNVIEAFPDAVEILVKRWAVLLAPSAIVGGLGALVVAVALGGDRIALLLFVVWLLAWLWNAAYCCLVVKDYKEGLGQLEFGEAAVGALKAIPRLFGTMVVLFVIYIAVAIAYWIVAGIVGISLLTSDRETAIVTLILMELTFLILVIGITVRWLLVVPVIVIEQVPTSSLARSAAIVNGRSFQFAFLYFVLSLCSGGVLMVVGVTGYPLVIATGMLGSTMWGLIPALALYRVREERQPVGEPLSTGWSQIPTTTSAYAAPVDPRTAHSVAPPSVAPPMQAPQQPTHPAPPPPPPPG